METQTHSSNHKSMKVAMVVLNSVSHDIRILKEARSLKSFGYDVSIIGLLDNRTIEREQIDGIKIFRVSSKNNKSLYRLRKIMFFLYSRKFLYVIIYTLFFKFFHDVPDFGSYSSNFLEDVFKILSILFSSYTTLFCGLFLILFGERIYFTIARSVLKIKQVFFGYLKLVRELLFIFKKKELIFEVLEELDPDIVHCHDLNSLIIGAAYKKKKRGCCKLVYDSHEIFEHTMGSGRIRQMVFTFIQKKLSQQVDKFITINQSIADFLKSKYPELPQATIVKNAAVFKKIEGDHNKLSECIGISKEKKILLFQGGFSSGRGLLELVKAGQFLKEDWVVVFMGWGKLTKLLQERSRKLGSLNKRVFFCDKVSQEELPYWTANATIGIIPYENTCLNHWFCTPNKLWEYTLAGVPILASPFPEIKKIINQGVGWLLETPLSAINIADIINNLSESEIEIAKIKSMEFINVDNWAKYEERLLNLYNEMIHA